MSAFFSFGTSFVISFRRNCNVEKIEKRQYFCKKKGCSFENLYIFAIRKSSCRQIFFCKREYSEEEAKILKKSSESLIKNFLIQ